MATLALSAELLGNFSGLEKRSRNRVLELAGIFDRSSVSELGSQSGVNLEKHTGQLDPRARTVRIDRNHRGVVFAAEDNETFILHKILTHDESDAWMARNKFKANVQTGALEVVDVEAIELAAREPKPDTEAEPIFAHRKDKDFRQLGIEEDLIPALRAFTNDEQLQGVLLVLPPGQSDALIELTGIASPDEIYSRIAGSFEPGSLSEEDIGAALGTPASRSQFRVVSDDAEIRDMLDKPMAKWRTFLHNSQHQLAYKPVHNGPVRVTGGAGTGKTVVAIHRAKHLADQLDEPPDKQILFTTFTRNLAEAIEDQLADLGGQDILNAIDVVNVDRLAARVVRTSEGSNPQILSGTELRQLWSSAAAENGLYTAEFLEHEWEQVVLAQRCRSREDYFQATRAGRGVRLDRRARATVWDAVRTVEQHLAERRQRTFLQLADTAAEYLERQDRLPYRHVIVDEAQDLHETQWRMLRASVPEGPNDLFVVGDSHQRIYDRRSSLSKVGINIRGRSHRLRINYRTTHEILRRSLKLLGDNEFDDLDGGTETHDYAGYHSFMHGPEPTLFQADSRQEEINELASRVEAWIADGVAETDIGVAARRGDDLGAIEDVLSKRGINTCRLGSSSPHRGGVRLGNMHRVKGLEFRCVAIPGVDRGRVPEPAAVTDESADPVQHRQDLVRERSLLYVAATRAREDLWIGWSGTPSRFL